MTEPNADAPRDADAPRASDEDAQALLPMEEPPESDADGDKRALPDLDALVEAALFMSDAPRTAREIASLLADASAQQRGDNEGDELWSARDVRAAMDRIRARYAETSLAIDLVEIAGGWEFRTRRALAPWLQPVARRRPVKLGRAALEVLAVVAYRQPCTRADVDDVRGVDSSSTLRTLLSLKLLRILGRSEDVGRPLVYGTSDEFLRLFSLKSLAELPTLREFSELSEEHMLTLAELDRLRDTDVKDESEGNGGSALNIRPNEDG